MEKRFLNYLVFPVVLGVLILSMTAFAATGTIDATDDAGVETNTFTTNDDVYLHGTCADAADLTVPVYVVEHRATWTDQDALVEVRSGGTTDVTFDASGDISLFTLWANPTMEGEYDIVVDLDSDGLWDEATEGCVDHLTEVGFTVADPGVGGGTLSAAVGTNDPGDHEWVVGEGDPHNIMMTVDLTADATEDIMVTEFVLTASGTGHDSVGISEVWVVEDANDNGTYEDDTDFSWGNWTYDADDGSVSIAVGETIDADSTRTAMIIYVMSEDAADGDTYSFTLDDIDATGATSAADIVVAELPLSSGVKTVSDPAAAEVCEGPITLVLDPATAEPEATVEATVSGMDYCATTDIEVKMMSCDGTVVCTATSTDGADGTCTFNAPASTGDADYYACYDFNEDTDLEDDGESATATLTVEEAEPVTVTDPIAEEFTDIDGHWAEDFIEDLRVKGVVGGKEEGIFAPDDLITRAELTKMALLAFDHEIPEEEDLELPFTDVEATDWFLVYLVKALETEIVQGYEDGTFLPNQPINRVEVLKILIEAAGMDPSASPLATFPDTEEEGWYVEYLNYAIEMEVVGGYTGGEFDGMFRPGHTATRAEVAKMLSILMSL